MPTKKRKLRSSTADDAADDGPASTASKGSGSAAAADDGIAPDGKPWYGPQPSCGCRTRAEATRKGCKQCGWYNLLGRGYCRTTAERLREHKEGRGKGRAPRLPTCVVRQSTGGKVPRPQPK